MAFDSLAALWDMNGHGVFVWLAYSITLVLIVGYWLRLLQHNKQVRRHIVRLHEREQRAGLPANDIIEVQS